MSISSNMPTWLDVVKGDEERDVVNLLAQMNEPLGQMVWLPSSEPDGNHKETVTTALPEVAVRRFNQGALVQKGEDAELNFNYTIHEVWSEIDCDLIPNPSRMARHRAKEFVKFMEAMSQSLMRTILYGAAGEIVGLMSYVASLSGVNADNVIDAGGTGSDNCSILLAVLGEGSVHCTYPDGSNGGIVHENKGKQTREDGARRLDVWADKYQVKHGVVVADWRQLVRICNIDVSNLKALSSNAALDVMMIRARNRVFSLKRGKPVFMMNRTCMEALELIARTAVGAGGGLTTENVDGFPVTMWSGIPCLVTDAILNTEAAVA